MFRFVCGDVGDGSEDIARVCRGTLNAVSVIDTTSSSFRIHIEVLEVVIEIDGTGAEVSSEEGRVSRENRSNIDAALFAKREGYPR